VHELAVRTSDSQWHRDLSRVGEASAPYWLTPFKNGKTFCPYLVGSYERVGEGLGRYVAAGSTTFILDIPPSEEELHHTRLAFEHAAVEVV
jgi:alkanesulfonate monooxygenase